MSTTTETAPVEQDNLTEGKIAHAYCTCQYLAMVMRQGPGVALCGYSKTGPWEDEEHKDQRCVVCVSLEAENSPCPVCKERR